LRELLAELFGERGEVVEALGPVPIKGLGKLADAVGGRGKLLQYGGKLLILKAKKS
jgi:hypothetical protein